VLKSGQMSLKRGLFERMERHPAMSPVVKRQLHGLNGGLWVRQTFFPSCLARAAKASMALSRVSDKVAS